MSASSRRTVGTCPFCNETARTYTSIIDEGSRLLSANQRGSEKKARSVLRDALMTLAFELAGLCRPCSMQLMAFTKVVGDSVTMKLVPPRQEQN